MGNRITTYYHDYGCKIPSGEDTKVTIRKFYSEANIKLTTLLEYLFNKYKSPSNTDSLKEDAKDLNTSIRKARDKLRTIIIPRNSKNYNGLLKVSCQGTELMDKAWSVSESLGNIIDKDKGPEDLLRASEILAYAPLVGAGFALITPVLILAIKNVEVSDLVFETFRNISAIINKINEQMKKTKREKIPLSVDEVKTIRTLFKVIDEGIQAVISVIEGRESKFGRFLKLNIHKEALTGWIATTNKMLDDQAKHNISMVSYRTRYMVEKQREHFKVLTLASFINIILAAAGLYFVLDIRRIILADGPLVKASKYFLDQTNIIRDKFSHFLPQTPVYKIAKVSLWGKIKDSLSGRIRDAVQPYVGV